MLTTSSRKLFPVFSFASKSANNFFISSRRSYFSLTHSNIKSSITSPLSSLSLPYSSSLSYLSTSRRFFSNEIKTKKEWDEEIKLALARNSHEALVLIQKGCDSGQLTLTDEEFRQYYKLALTHNVNINLQNAIRAYLAGQNGSTMASNPSFLLGASPGLDRAHPIHVALKSATWKEQLISLGLKSLIFLIAITVLLTLMDDKNLGGGIAGRMTGSAVHRAETSDKTFDDVVGVDEAKEELQEIVQYLKDPKKFTRLGGKLPKGVLLTGPPGTGKTLLAKAVAGEAGVRFLYSSGSEFEEMFVGVGAKRVRELFQQAAEESPCIIFIDEIDAIGGTRNMKDSSAMKMTLNQLLVEMDGFKENSGIIVIAATNYAESLDNALIRPGRIDKQVNVGLPDIGGRRAILEHYGKKVPTSPDVDYEQLARGTPGFSGADLANLINEAAIRAAVRNLPAIDMKTLEFSKDKIMMGSERQSAIISKETMEVTAYHEAGHALISLLTDGADPIHKATIMPRGRALGMVMQLPDGDQTSLSRKQMLAKLDICMGGRIAEELIFGSDNVTSGATSDFQQATRLADAMITKWGFSSKLGIQYFDEKMKFSGETQSIIDQEIRTLLEESYTRAKNLLQFHRNELELIAKALMEHETLSGSEIADVVKGKPLNLRVRSQKASREPKAMPEHKTKKPTLPPVPLPKPVVPATATSSTTSSTTMNTSKSTATTNNTTAGAASSSSSASTATATATPIRGPPGTPKTT